MDIWWFMKINNLSQRAGITQRSKVFYFLGGAYFPFLSFLFFSLPFFFLSFFSLVCFFLLVSFFCFFFPFFLILFFFPSFFFHLFIFLHFPLTLWRPFLLWLLGLPQVFILVWFLEQLMALLVFHCPLGVGVGPFVTFHVPIVGSYFPSVIWLNIKSIVRLIRLSF
jgi:hypothetical protein